MRILETARLLLSPTTEPLPLQVLETMHQMYIHEFEGEGLTIEALAQEIQFDVQLSRNTLGLHFGRPAICLKTTSQRIGHALFLPRLCTPAELAPVLALGESSQHSSIELEIGWAIANRYRNQGYATEAAQALIDYGLNDLGVARLVAFTESDNHPSVKVMKKLGMRIGQSRATEGIVGVIERTIQ